MLKLCLCYYSGTYILVKETVSVAITATAGAAASDNDKKK